MQFVDWYSQKARQGALVPLCIAIETNDLGLSHFFYG